MVIFLCIITYVATPRPFYKVVHADTSIFEDALQAEQHCSTTYVDLAKKHKGVEYRVVPKILIKKEDK